MLKPFDVVKPLDIVMAAHRIAHQAGAFGEFSFLTVRDGKVYRWSTLSKAPLPGGRANTEIVGAQDWDALKRAQRAARN